MACVPARGSNDSRRLRASHSQVGVRLNVVDRVPVLANRAWPPLLDGGLLGLRCISSPCCLSVRKGCVLGDELKERFVRLKPLSTDTSGSKLIVEFGLFRTPTTILCGADRTHPA